MNSKSINWDSILELNLKRKNESFTYVLPSFSTTDLKLNFLLNNSEIIESLKGDEVFDKNLKLLKILYDSLFMDIFILCKIIL